MEDNNHLLYFISCGPGDPDLITLAGLKALERCDSVLAPDHYADIFSPYLTGKEVETPFIMERGELTSWIDERLVRGSVGIMVPGDFTTFNPFQSFAGQYRDRAVVIPGVGAHSAAAAILTHSYDVPGVAHATVVSSPKAYRRDAGKASISELGGEGKTLVLYMNDLPLPDLVTELLKCYTPATPMAIVERIGLPEQNATVAPLADIVDKIGDRDPFMVGTTSKEPALALVVVGESIGVDEAPHWWDHRYHKVWHPRGMR